MSNLIRPVNANLLNQLLLAGSNVTLSVVGSQLQINATNGGLTTLGAFSTTNVTTTSATDVLLSGMSIIAPAAGTYLLFFNTTSSNSINNAQNTFSVYVNGSQISTTVRVLTQSPVNAQKTVVIIASITVSTGNVEVRWKTNNPTATCYNRTLNLLKV